MPPAPVCACSVTTAATARPLGPDQQAAAGSSSSAAAALSSASAMAALGPGRSQLHSAAVDELLRLLRPGLPSNAQNALPGAPATHTSPSYAAGSALSDSGEPPIDPATFGLSMEKPWDWEGGSGSSGGPGGSGAAGGAKKGTKKGAKGRGGKAGGSSGAAGAAGRKRERTIHERYLDVEAFWRSCTPEERRALLQVPVRTLLDGECQGRGRGRARAKARHGSSTVLQKGLHCRL
jgi:hypothetical protein